MAKKPAPIVPSCQAATTPSPLPENPHLPAPPPPGGAKDPIPHILPFGGISLLSGAPGLGKTALLASLAGQLLDGRPVFGHQPNPIAGLGYICADRAWAGGAGVWFERAKVAGIVHYSMVEDPSFQPRTLRRKFDRTRILAEMIDKLTLPPGSLVMVDPMGLFLGGSLLDYDSCACACHELRAILRERQLTIWGAAHSAKLRADKSQRYARLQDQILGSTALLGFSDTQMYLASPEETGRTCYTFLWLPHLAPVETFQLERDDHGLFALASGSDRPSCIRILDLFPNDGGPITLGELTTLAQEIPYTMKTVQRALDQLISDGTVVRIKRGQYARRHLVH